MLILLLSVRRRLCFWQMYQNTRVLVLYYVRIQLSVSFNGPEIEDDYQASPDSLQLHGEDCTGRVTIIWARSKWLTPAGCQRAG